MDDAREIYQSHLDEVSRAVWNRDMPTIFRLHELPNFLRFPQEEQRLDTEADLNMMVTRFRDQLDGLGATGYHRVCERVTVSDTAGGCISGGHWTYILRGGNYLGDPYYCDMILRRHGSIWKIAEITLPPLRNGIPVGKSLPPCGSGMAG